MSGCFWSAAGRISSFLRVRFAVEDSEEQEDEVSSNERFGERCECVVVRCTRDGLADGGTDEEGVGDIERD
jgi:hypothetical protein